MEYLRQWQVQRRVAEGRFGTVFAATNIVTGQAVAVKMPGFTQECKSCIRAVGQQYVLTTVFSASPSRHQHRTIILFFFPSVVSRRCWPSVLRSLWETNLVDPWIRLLLQRLPTCVFQDMRACRPPKPLASQLPAASLQNFET